MSTNTNTNVNADASTDASADTYTHTHFQAKQSDSVSSSWSIVLDGLISLYGEPSLDLFTEFYFETPLPTSWELVRVHFDDTVFKSTTRNSTPNPLSQPVDHRIRHSDRCRRSARCICPQSLDFSRRGMDLFMVYVSSRVQWAGVGTRVLP